MSLRRFNMRDAPVSRVVVNGSKYEKIMQALWPQFFDERSFMLGSRSWLWGLAVRLILAFEGDRRQFSAKNTMLSDLTQALTGEPLPYATLMYVWCNHRPVGTVIVNPRTDRVRKLVVESGADHLKQWRHYQRDVRADFEKAFGEAPGALVGMAIMTDSDNTRGNVRAWYGDIRLD
jgi:hypothetical protein